MKKQFCFVLDYFYAYDDSLKYLYPERERKILKKRIGIILLMHFRPVLISFVVSILFIAMT